MSGPSFNLIAASIQPAFRAEVSNSKAAGGATARPSLVIGQALGTGYVANVPVKVLSTGTANALFRTGSQLARAIAAYLANDPFAELWALPVDDSGTGVAAALSLKFVVTGTPGYGSLYLYIAGQRLVINVTPASTATSIGDAIAAALGINEAAAFAAGSTFPVTATNSSGTVTFLARNKGSLSNQIDFRVNYLGSASGEQYPVGVVAQYYPTGLAWTDLALAYQGNNATAPACNASTTSTSNGTILGANDPSLTTAIANMGDRRYSFVVCPYSTKGTGLPITLLATEFADSLTGRWGPQKQVYGHVYSALNSTAATLYGLSTDNSPHVSIFGIEASPTPPCEIAAAFAGAIAPSIRNDPARPLNTLILQGVLAPSPADQFNYTEREQILANGITTPLIDPAGNVRIQRAISTYTKNAYGAADKSYRDITTPATLDFILTEMGNYISNAYSRVKLVDNDMPIQPGTNCVNCNSIRNALIDLYVGWERLAIVENSAVFSKLIRVTRDTDGNPAGDPTVVNVYFPPDLVNGLMNMNALAEFRLQYSPADLAA